MSQILPETLGTPRLCTWRHQNRYIQESDCAFTKNTNRPKTRRKRIFPQMLEIRDAEKSRLKFTNPKENDFITLT